MSRIGKKPIEMPEGVNLEISGREVGVTGPKGTLFLKLPRGISVKKTDGTIEISRSGNSKNSRALHGTYRALFANVIKGVTDGWSKTLELVGTGYRAEASGKTLTLSVGYSHPVKIEAPEGIDLEVEKTKITVNGIDKELVGQIAAEIRGVRPPEPYKGKGIKYQDEEIRRKPGKAARAAQGVGVA
ncbi:MAG: 50S ribosomal protein L6 [Patescibacteria group bacterium]